MLPKNIRQIGQIEGNKRIYIEDYVMTYARKIEGMAVLLGKQEVEGDNQVFYISGAVEVKNTAYGYPTILTNEDWSGIYEGIKEFFSELEIMGWLLVRRNTILEIDEEIRRIHEENFKGKDKILFLYDKEENEEAFYIANTLGDLKKQSGYYIFYEKNEAMQNYMIDKNTGEKVEEERRDEAMEKVREIIAHKEPLKNEKKMMNLMYGASTVLAAVVLVIGATMLDNYDKMKNMEKTLSVISSSLDKEDTETGDVVKVEQINGNTERVETEGSKDAKNEYMEQSEEETETVKDDEQQTPDNEPQKEEDKDASEKDSESEIVKEEPKKEEPKKEESKKEQKEQKEETKAVNAPVAREYVVKDGDTLASISYKLYQTYTYVEKIQKLNEIDDSDIIYAGQKLQLP